MDLERRLRVCERRVLGLSAATLALGQLRRHSSPISSLLAGAPDSQLLPACRLRFTQQDCQVCVGNN